MEDKPSPKKFNKKVMCKVCQQETWHIILNEKRNRWSNPDGLWEDTTFFTLQCLGCDNVCLLVHYIFSEDIDTHTGDPELQVSIYPSPYKNDREKIKGFFNLPSDIKTVYEETIKAFNSEIMILTAIGIRTIIEAIAIDQKITVRGIETKITNMVNRGIVTPDAAKLLLLIKDVGNLATHEIKKQHHDDLSLCLDIVEDILKILYIYPKEAEYTEQIIKGKWKRVD